MNPQMDIDHLRQKLQMHVKHTPAAIKIQKQIDLLEDAIIIYRLVNPPRA